MRIESVFYWVGSIWFVAGLAISNGVGGLFLGLGVSLMLFASINFIGRNR